MQTLFNYLALAVFSVGCFYGGRVVAEFLRRGLDIAERKVKVLELHTQGPAIPTSIPPDLYRRITKWMDQDAQESERKILLDLYNEFRDAPDPWVEVRSHLPKEPSDEWPTEIYTQ